MNGNVIGANIYLGVPIPAPPPAPPITPASLPGYDATFDASRLRSATKGFGTDEKTLITVLTSLDAYQIDLLTRVFEGSYGKSLSKTLESELSGDLEYGLVLLSQGPLAGDIWLMNRACKGMGTHEDLLCEVLLNRTNWEMWALKEGYKRVYGKDLVQVVKGELSMKTERCVPRFPVLLLSLIFSLTNLLCLAPPIFSHLPWFGPARFARLRLFIMALAGTRDESPQVNHQLVEQDMNTLYKSGEGRLGTDEIAICSILTQRSDAHLLALSQAYTSRHRHTLTQAIGKEFSGHMREGLHLIARAHENPNASVELDAELLEDAMDGVGTKDERLIYRVVRGHWNRPRWEGVKSAYKRMYGKELSKRIKGETTGKYEVSKRDPVGVVEEITLRLSYQCCYLFFPIFFPPLPGFPLITLRPSSSRCVKKNQPTNTARYRSDQIK